MWNEFKPERFFRRALVYFVLIAFLLFALTPIFLLVVAALRDPNEIVLNPLAWPKKFTLVNLAQAWTVGHMGRYFLNSIIVAVPRVLGVLTLSTLAGYAFAKLSFPGQKVIFYVILCGLMIPIQAMIIPLYVDMEHLGLINTYWSMIIPYFGLSMPFAIFMMRAFFRDLPDELIEAGKMDGCGDFRVFYHILLPLILPAVSSLMVFEFVWSWNDFLIPLLFVYNDSLRTLPLGLMYFSTQYTTNQTLIAAAVTITTLPIIVLYLIFQRKFTQGLMAGASK